MILAIYFFKNNLKHIEKVFVKFFQKLSKIFKIFLEMYKVHIFLIVFKNDWEIFKIFIYQSDKSLKKALKRRFNDSYRKYAVLTKI